MSDSPPYSFPITGWPGVQQLQEYCIDAWQRTILCLDVLRQRADTYNVHTAQTIPNVLHFKAKLVRDGRILDRPVNYVLVRIVPPSGTNINPTKAPVIVVDPRAGHGPGIGGMKHDSQIGVALAAGHPCYFIGFLPNPMPGQTVEDVCLAEAVFLQDVAELHPEAESKPVVIANCQAGWQIMMMAAINPGLTGPIMLAGSPLSYWAGVRGKNPLRYLGGILGGTWMTALAGDLGNGVFDGAHLVANFESLNPSNTYWTKPYNVYSKVDTEADRFLEFETWWGSPVLLNAEEMQWIADNLFVGNRLSAGHLRTSDGVRIDLRNIRSPIIVFCSWGDNITPPQQALGWVLDLYDHEREIVANGQTIIYTLHHSIGHLGIFVSGKVATKEHDQFVSCMDLIDVMPPGLYEAVITEADADAEDPRLVHGRYLLQFETRTLNHLRALGGNDAEDEQRFATAARVSDVNLGLYRALVHPWIGGGVAEPMAAALRALHPNRMRFGMFSKENPMMQPVQALAEQVRAERKPVSDDNVFLAAERAVSSWIAASLQAYGSARDALAESMFLNIYGSPFLQALVGLNAQEQHQPNRIARDMAREATQSDMRAELAHHYEVGHLEEAILRALIYIRMPQGSIDDRVFEAIKIIRASRPPEQRRSLAQFKEMARDQFLLVLLDEERAVRTLPVLLGNKPEDKQIARNVLHTLLAARGALPDACKRRLDQIETLFNETSKKPAKSETTHA